MSIAQFPSSHPLTWVTFCRGDAVDVVDDGRLPVTNTVVTDVDGEWVHTACGHRWQQGTGAQVACVHGGRAEVLEGVRIRPQTQPHPWAEPLVWDGMQHAA